MTHSTNSTLFTPYTTGKLSVDNRIVMAPMTRMRSPGHVPTQEAVQYYRRRAEGGTGLIITECTFVDHPAANAYPDVPAFYGETALAGWRRVVSGVHAAGGKIVPQIWHAGLARAPSTGPNEDVMSVGPMDLHEEGQQVVRAMNRSDIQAVIHAFVQAAQDAQALGFDGVEVSGAHSFLIDQFLWRESNQREDDYGGSLANRVRFAREIVLTIRAATDPDFPILFRFSQWKQSDYNARIAETPHDLEQILTPLVDAGVDIFHASTRRFWQAAFDGSDLSLAGWTKRITGKPTIAVGHVGIDSELSMGIFAGEKVKSRPASIEKVEAQLASGEFDLVAVGRALLSDSEWPRKMKAGLLEEITPFTSESLRNWWQ